MQNKKSWYRIEAAGKSSADIYIYDSIGFWGVTAKDFAKDLKAAGDLKEITLHINSPGGDVFDGTAIYNLLKAHKATINTVIEGVAASMGSVIALAGDTVTIAENAYYMIHNPAGIAIGEEKDMDRVKSLLSKVKATMVNLYSEKSGKEPEEIMQLMDDETWYVGAEAVEAGFATSTSEAIEMAASFNVENLSQYKNIPASLAADLYAGINPITTKPSAVADKLTTKKEAIMPIEKPTKPVATADEQAVDTETLKAQVASELMQAEEQRRETIQGAFKGFESEHGPLMQTCLADMKCDVSAAKDKLLAAINKKAAQEKPTHSYSVVVEEGEGMKRMKAHAANAIAARAGLEKREEGNGLLGYTLFETARMMLEARGFNTAGLDKLQLVAAAFTHTSGDFSSVLANTANKAMLKGYEEAEEVFTRFTSVGSLPDFKTISRVDTGSFPSLRQVTEGAEYKYITLGERAESTVLATYGELFSITRQAIINDDLNAFTRIPMKMGRAAVRTVGDLVFNIFLNNPVMADSTALFHADHSNLAGAAVASPTTAGIDTARVGMALQKDGAATLNIRPAYLLCSPSLEGAAKVALGSEFEVGASTKNNTVPNSVRGIAEVISDARLNGHAAWYLLANQNMHDTIEVMYLDGNSSPVLEQQNGWNIDGTEFKVRIDAAAKAWDAKGMYKTPTA